MLSEDYSAEAYMTTAEMLKKSGAWSSRWVALSFPKVLQQTAGSQNSEHPEAAPAP